MWLENKMRQLYRSQKNTYYNDIYLKIMIKGALLTFFISVLATTLFLPEKINLLFDQENVIEFNIPFVAKFEENQIAVTEIIDGEKTVHTSASMDKPLSLLPKDTKRTVMEVSLFGIIPIKKVDIDVIENKSLIPCGNTVGVRINTKGVMVLGTGVVNAENGKAYEPAKPVFKSGDLIFSVNGELIDTKEDLIKSIEENGEKELFFDIKRNDKYIMVSTMPVKAVEDNKYKVGIWVRDSTQGIGTITYIDPETNTFGALGHGILDVDTKGLMSIKDGKVMPSLIADVKKGKKGVPGELVGEISTDSAIGSVDKNTELGIYGHIFNVSDLTENNPIPIGLQQDITLGMAHIYSNVVDDKIEKYEIEIQKINRYNSDEQKGMVIKITDERLLDITGGIVQGMSGSPIVQNDKIIGAITHVFVQEPAKGYAVFIENMLKKENATEVTTELKLSDII